MKILSIVKKKNSNTREDVLVKRTHKNERETCNQSLDEDMCNSNYKTGTH